jgi:hypothetical protein
MKSNYQLPVILLTDSAAFNTADQAFLLEILFFIWSHLVSAYLTENF